MKKILTLLIPLIALGGGIAAGEMLRPKKDGAEVAATDLADIGEGTADAENHAGTTQDTAEAGHGTAASSGHGENTGQSEADASGPGWFTFPTQFFVPLMRNGDMGAMIIVTLSLETQAAQIEAMNQQQHRLRDALLRELMIHANTGGFDGNFTTEPAQRVLRERLLKAIHSATDLPVDAVLIEGIARQAS